LRSFRNRDTGEVKQIAVSMRVRQWWFVHNSWTAVLQVKYGSKVIDISKGKNLIEIRDRDHLIKTLETLREAILNGEPDTQIESAANIVKSRFKN